MQKFKKVWKSFSVVQIVCGLALFLLVGVFPFSDAHADLVVEKETCEPGSQAQCVQWFRNDYGYYVCVAVFDPCVMDDVFVPQSLPSE